MKVALFSVLLLLAGCTAHEPSPPGPARWAMPWQTSQDAKSPLVGRIWNVRTQRWASPAELRRAVAGAHFVLLGETHDNPDHHRLQAALLQAVVDSGRRPGVAFEMLDLDQQPALDRFLASHPADGTGLGPAVDWADSGWPAWSMYQPIADVAVAAKLPIFAANLPSATVKAVALKGYDALDPARVQSLGLRQPWPQARIDTMLQEIFVSHCELMPKSALGGMVKAQRTRNAIMAARLRDSAGADGAVLVAGAGHVRTDFGVPLELRRDHPRVDSISVAMIEARPGSVAPADYATDYNVKRLPFDYVVFTPGAERDDPCEALKKRFGAMSKGAG